jgi:hypothetical protein
MSIIILEAASHLVKPVDAHELADLLKRFEGIVVGDDHGILASGTTFFFVSLSRSRYAAQLISRGCRYAR